MGKKSMSGEVLVKGKYIIYKVDSRRLAESKSGNDVLVQFKIQDSRFKIEKIPFSNVGSKNVTRVTGRWEFR